MIPDYNLLCQTRSLYNEPYHTVRPLLPIRLQHGSRMIEWAEHTFGPAGERVRGCVGQTVKVKEPGLRYYVDPTAFWFRHSKDRDCFVAHWTQELENSNGLKIK
jgi:hypothetical protein